MEEIEYYSNCCDAPPLGELSYEEKYDAEPIGMCMSCRDGSLFRPSTLEEIREMKVYLQSFKNKEKRQWK